MTTIGVLGPKGRLGSWLVRCGAEPVECDVTDFASIVDALSKRHYDVLVNCAAYTRVTDAEKIENQERVIVVNYKSLTFVLAAMHHKTHFIHLSTDYVFGGQRGPYTERSKFTKADKPVNYYGLTKQAAELALTDMPRTTIVRVTGLFGSGQSDFVTFVMNDLSKGKPIVVADDLISNQTYVPFLAAQIMDLAVMESKVPILHLASVDRMTRYAFASKIADKLGCPRTFVQPAHSNFIWDVPRPLQGGLDVSLSKKLGFRQYTIEEGLCEYLDAASSE